MARLALSLRKLYKLFPPFNFVGKILAVGRHLFGPRCLPKILSLPEIGSKSNHGLRGQTNDGGLVRRDPSQLGGAAGAHTDSRTWRRDPGEPAQRPTQSCYPLAHTFINRQRNSDPLFLHNLADTSCLPAIAQLNSIPRILGVNPSQCKPLGIKDSSATGPDESAGTNTPTHAANIHRGFLIRAFVDAIHNAFNNECFIHGKYK